jgi:uncharacterized membrane protein
MIMVPNDQRVVATFTAYAEAERAVDYLADRNFPVERVSIVGRDVRLVEKVLGRVGYPQAVLHGAGGGAVTGALIGWIFGLFDWVSPLVAGLWLALDGLVFGAIVGAIFGALFKWLEHGRRDFASVRTMVPDRYDLLVDSAVADRADQILHEGSDVRRVHTVKT